MTDHWYSHHTYKDGAHNVWTLVTTETDGRTTKRLTEQQKNSSACNGGIEIILACHHTINVTND